jgi:hypothetical protein
LEKPVRAYCFTRSDLRKRSFAKKFSSELSYCTVACKKLHRYWKNGKFNLKEKLNELLRTKAAL